MKELHEYKIILWDFDGVIMDSMPTRSKGFELVLARYPENQVQQLMDFHLKNGGLSRYAKFRYFFETIRGEELLAERLDLLANEFSSVMRVELLNPALLIEDSISFIKKNYQKFTMHVVSGSDQTELRFLCEQLEIQHYFRSILGSPTPKIQLVAALIEQELYNKADILFIGDSINDYDAAVFNEIDFMGYNNQLIKDLGKNYITSFC
jgi:phosphoglycolate phosphatase-like HAD superfamily hydrolase